MPRGKKTLSGAPASAPTTPVGVPYGEGERRIEAQRRMPVPDFAGGGSAPTTGGTGGGGAAGDVGGADRFAQALEAARQMAPPEGLLAAPTQRPMEPLQAGLPGSANPVPPGPVTSDALYELRALVQRAPYPEFLQLLAWAEQEM
jgi:hypothetical protein